MKFLAVASAFALIGAVAAAPVESEVLAKAHALYKRNSAIATLLREQSGLTKRSSPTDADILNFALQLEYLEAQFYSYSYYGSGLDGSLLTGTGKQGGVSGGKKVPFSSSVIEQYAKEIASDEKKHVQDLRAALGKSAVAQPAINIGTSFTAAATAAGIISKGQTFDPYASDTNFLLGAFLFEDVGVTAYNGAAPLISSKDYLAAAAGILAVEAYHASEVRTTLFSLGQQTQALITNANKAAAAIGSLGSGRSEGIQKNGVANIVPTTSGSLAFNRSPAQVLAIVYLSGPNGASSGGFFPNGLNGYFHTANSS